MCDVVVKIGGSLLASPADLDRVLGAVTDLAGRCRLLIVPGGGPFADTVREVDRRVGIPADAAHWMAILAMDQYAHVLAARLGGIVVTSASGVGKESEGGQVPVLAPSRWLQDTDALPHTWDVTSDSIAAWVAGQVGARHLVVVKAAGAAGALLDPYFPRALPPGVTPVVVTADLAPVALRHVLPPECKGTQSSVSAAARHTSRR